MAGAQAGSTRPTGSGLLKQIPLFGGGLLVALILDLTLDKAISDSSIRQLLMLAACNILVALSLNVINGMAGQFSIGHAGFLGLGGYSAAVVSANLHEALGGGEATFGKSFIVVPASLLVAALLSGIAGLFVGLPSLRLKGDYLAIVTLGFSEIFRLVIATAQIGDKETIAHAWASAGSPRGFVHAISVMITSLGGQNGYAGPKDAGVPLYAGPFWVVGLAFVLGVVAWRLKFSGWGRALRALRDDEIAASAVGVDPTRYKVTSFVLSAAGAGIAGALLSTMRNGNPTVQPDQFNFNYSFDLITMVILGGSGSVSGAVVGGVLVTFTVKLIEQLQGLESIQALKVDYPSLDLNALRMVVYAGVLIALMILRPAGIFGEREIVGRKATVKTPGSGKSAKAEAA